MSNTDTKTQKRLKVLINDNEVEASEGDTILKVAERAGVHIPTLCYHEKIKPHGACRLCLVEVQKGNRSKMVAACAYPVEDGLIIYTESEKVEDVRKRLVELYMALFPYNQEIKTLAKKYGISQTRYKKQNDYCILCGLCVRYCAEVKGNNAIGFVNRGSEKKVAFIPESAYFKYCESCMDCVDLCPTGVFPSNFGIERISQVSDT